MGPLIDIRIYRAAAVLSLLALVVLMFSLERRPPPLASTLAPDAFDYEGSYAALRQVTERLPDRRPGSRGDEALAALVEGRFETFGFETSRDHFVADSEGEDVAMTNVLGVLSGPSERQIVVLAHRDALERPGASSAASTAMLIELASALAAVRHDKTIVFVSADGGMADGAGAQRFADTYNDADKVDAALVLAEVGAARPRRPYILPWGSDSRRSAFQLLRTTDAALRREIGSPPGNETIFGQYMRLAWPLTLREQGPLVAAGIDAVTLTSHGEVPRDPSGDTLEDISRTRLLQFGKAALATLLAIDAAPRVEQSQPRYLVVGRRVLPGWALSLLAIALIVPVLLTAADGYSRAHRRGSAVGAGIRRALAAALPFLALLVGARAFQAIGWLPETASEALSPPTEPSTAEALPALAALAVLFALAWVLARPLMRPPPAAAEGVREETAVAVAALLSLELVVLWIGHPFSALMLVPALHLCLLAALPVRGPRRILAGATLLAALLLPAAVVVYYGDRFDLGLDLSRQVLLLVTSGGSALTTLLSALIAGSVLMVVLTALAESRAEPERGGSVRGPRTYAGPGSLGGTESAFRR